MNWCAQRSRERFAALLAERGLHPREFGLLNVVAASPDVTQQALGEAAGIDPSTMVATLDALEARGLAERRPHPTDRRKRVVRLTRAGEEELARARVLARRAGEELLAALTVQERADLHRLLREARRARTIRPPRAAAAPAPRAPRPRTRVPRAIWSDLPMANGIAPTYRLRRCRLADGERTTLYVVRHASGPPCARASTSSPSRGAWTTVLGAAACVEAIVGGFYLRDPFRPLGEVRVGGEPGGHRLSRPAHRAAAPGPARGRRAGGDRAARPAVGARPGGDLLQAGPLLVDDGADRLRRRAPTRRASAPAAGQFDSDITDGRHPRAAIGLDDRSVWLLACDGRRSGVDAGLTMLELAELMAELGCRVAMNLDGGGSTTLVHHGHLLNRPYSEQDQPAPASRPIVTAVVLEAR